MPERARDSPEAIRMDLHMLMLLRARERTEAQFRDLLAGAALRSAPRRADRVRCRPERARGDGRAG